MNRRNDSWTLGAKLALLTLPFLFVGLLITASTLWVSWQLDGGAAAVNEAGRMRMQVYRMAGSAVAGAREQVAEQTQEFQRSLELLRRGDPGRPLLMPWDDGLRQRFSAVEAGWIDYQREALRPLPMDTSRLNAANLRFIDRIDALVSSIEAHLSRWTRVLQLLQLATMGLGVLAAVALVIAGYRFVLEPLGSLKQAIARVRLGDFGARIERVTSDEFGALAEGFNDMAARLHSLYHDLEARVVEKTAELVQRRERLEALYDVSTLVTHAPTLDDLAQGFTRRVRAAAHADAAVLRWSDEGNQSFVMLASDGLSEAMVAGEQCIRTGDCFCGAPPSTDAARVIPIHALESDRRLLCERAGWATVVAIPIRIQERLMGEVNLFFHAQYQLAPAERELLEAMTAHLASGMENQRLHGLAQEAAIAQERGLLARELHDSIAQSLAFLKIQVQLMRDALDSGDRKRIAAVLDEIELGVRESHGDVRELLMHFRTRTNTEDIEPALKTTLLKFEHQTGTPTHLSLHGQGLPLAPDVQIHALHVVLEALSNIRKHAQAKQVWIEVWRQPVWRFEVRDDGVGFDTAAQGTGETHVGLRIMAERAERLGATLEVRASTGHGTTVMLTLPASARPAQQPAPPPVYSVPVH